MKWATIINGSGWWRILRHIVFWSFVYLDELVLALIVPQTWHDIVSLGLSLILDMITVYVTIYYILPKALESQRYVYHSMYIATLILINVLIITWFGQWAFDQEWYIEDYLSPIIYTTTVVASAIGIIIAKRLYHQVKMTQELQSQQHKLEIHALKEQINPHFLFNVLNTIYIQSQSSPESVSESIMQLSDLLRYQIYEAGRSEMVSLKKEIAFLKNYTQLEELRRAHFIVAWHQPEDLPNVKLKAFLFLPLIENALKHSQRTDDQLTRIEVHWHGEEKGVRLEVKNTLGNVSPKQDQGGFGLQNLKRRLDLLYQKTYQLKIERTDHHFVASLTIPAL